MLRYVRCSELPLLLPKEKEENLQPYSSPRAAALKLEEMVEKEDLDPNLGRAIAAAFIGFGHKWRKISPLREVGTFRGILNGATGFVPSLFEFTWPLGRS